MSFKLPRVSVVEKRTPVALDTFIENLSATYVISSWGDDTIKTIENERALVYHYGANKTDSISLQSALAYLQIVDGLETIRVVPDSGRNANSKSIATLAYKNADAISEAVTQLEAGSVTAIAKCVGDLGNSLKVVLVDNNNWDDAKHGSMFISKPSTSVWAREITHTNDELHVAVIDTKGEFSDTPNTILERFEFLSKGKNATSSENPKNYFINVVNAQSNYISLTKTGITVLDKDADIGAEVQKEATEKEFALLDGDNEYTLTAGVNGTVTVNDIKNTLDKFSSGVGTKAGSLFIADTVGDSGYATIVKHATTLAEKRGNLLVFRSPKRSDVVGQANDEVKISNVRLTEENLKLFSSYNTVDDNWGLVYNGATQTKLYIPMCAITCALWAKTANEYNIFTSSAGETRGIVNNILKLSCNIDRALTASHNVNSYVDLTGGIMALYGDRTCYKRKSPYASIGTRRLVIAIKNIVKKDSSSVLFEQNNNNVRLRFVSKTSQLIDVYSGQGAFNPNNAGGLAKGYLVEANPPTQLEIDNGEFKGSIVLYPTGSIESVEIGIMAVNSTINFREI